MKKFIALSVVLAGTCGFAQDTPEPASEPAKPAAPTRGQLKEKQTDAVLEAQAIEETLGKLKRASDLAKQRIVEASRTTDDASQALERGNSKQAQEEAAKAAVMFREIAKQLEALLKEETPQRIQAAQQMAQKLAEAERQFLRDFKGIANAASNGGRGKMDPNAEIQPSPKAQGGNNPDSQLPAPDKPMKDGQGGKVDPSSTKTPMPETPPTGDGAGGKNEKQPMGSGQGADKKPDDPKGEDKDNTQAGGGKTDKAAAEQAGSGSTTSKDETEKPEEKNGAGQGGSKPDKKNQKGAGGGMTPEQAREELAKQAEQLAQSGATLEDVLKSITESTSSAYNEAITKINELLKETNLKAAVANMQATASQIRNGKLEDARVGSLDAADRLEIASQRLGSVYRAVVAPKAENLIKLEQQIADLRERMKNLETPSDVRTLMRDLQELLSKLEEEGFNTTARDELLSQLRKAGVGSSDFQRIVREWLGASNRYEVPGVFDALALQLQEDLQERIQTLILGDLAAATDEVSPPKYQELVERYLQVLSTDSARATKTETRKIKSETKDVPRVDKPTVTREGQP